MNAHFTATPKPTLTLNRDILELALYRRYVDRAARTGAIPDGGY